jgi:hypothetical protein
MNVVGGSLLTDGRGGNAKALSFKKNEYIVGHSKNLFLKDKDFDIEISLKINAHVDNIVGVDVLGVNRHERGYYGYSLLLNNDHTIAFTGSCDGNKGKCDFVDGKYSYALDTWFTYKIQRRGDIFRTFVNNVLYSNVVRPNYIFHSSTGGFHMNHMHKGCCNKYGSSSIDIGYVRLQSWKNGDNCISGPVDHCNPNPCLNGGSCSGNGVCTCIDNFTGYRCHINPPKQDGPN